MIHESDEKTRAAADEKLLVRVIYTTYAFGIGIFAFKALWTAMGYGG